MKLRFKIDKNAPKVCTYCGKNLSKLNPTEYGIWVSQVEGTFYDCKECQKELNALIENCKNKHCTYRKWQNNENAPIEVCVICGDKLECEYRLRIVEDGFRMQKVFEREKEE